jgi:hypothetical protein
MAYWRLHYHAVWACKNREPLITAELEPELYKSKAWRIVLWQQGFGARHRICQQSKGASPTPDDA